MDFIKIYKDAYKEEFCEKIIDTYHILDEKGCFDEKFDVSDNKHRKDRCVFLDNVSENDSKEIIDLKSELLEEFHNRVIHYVNEYLKEFGLYEDFFLVPDGMKVHRYEHKKRGGYYVFHNERSNRGWHYLRREMAYTLYLNDIPEGEGETEFLYQGFRYQPRRGDLVIFPAGYTHVHRGNPVYTTDKYIITGWMLREEPTNGEDE